MATRAVYVSIPKARRVLDFGCGTGWVLAEAQTEGDPFRVGVDVNIESLQRAGKVSPGISFANGDGLRLPFADGSFDVVIGHVSMPYMNTTAALREIYRVLAPGGSLFLTFHSFFYLVKRLKNGGIQGLTWRKVLFIVYTAFNGVLNHWSLPQIQIPWRRSVFETVNTPTGIYRTAGKVGFSLISIEHCARHIFFAVTARKPNPGRGDVLPAPGWSVYCPLARP